MHYNRLIAGVLALNAAIAVAAVAAGWWDGRATSLEAIGAVAQANLVLAVLPRQAYVVNLVGWAATRPSAGVAAAHPLGARQVLPPGRSARRRRRRRHVSGTSRSSLSMAADRLRGAPAVTTTNVVLAGDRRHRVRRDGRHGAARCAAPPATTTSS